MLKQLRPALFMLLAMTVITGLIYPLVITGIAQVAFPHQANGSLITAADGKVAGSELIGQSFSRPDYFWGRPSAAGTGYDAANSSGSNLAASNKAYIDAVAQRVDEQKAANPAAKGPIPVDLVTASGSGLDPHISPAAALWQVSRVAAARNWPEDNLRRLVHNHIEGRQLGILGEPRVNVLRLNRALDAAGR